MSTDSHICSFKDRIQFRPFDMKRISQQFFDETVVSNMELLELTLDEAIEETVESFKTENVDLTSIIKESIKYKNGHPVIVAYERIKNKEASSIHDISNLITDLETTIGSLSAIKAMLVNMGAVDTFLELYDEHKSTGVSLSCLIVLQALITVIENQVGVIKENNLQRIINNQLELLNGPFETNCNLIMKFYSLLRLSCLQNEHNRELIARSAVVHQTLKLLNYFLDHPSVITGDEMNLLIKESCSFLRSLTLDDDMSVEFGCGSQNARTIAESESCLETIVKLLDASLKSSNSEQMRSYFLTLSAIINREEACIKFSRFGGIKILMQAVNMYSDSMPVTYAGLNLIKTLSGSDMCKREIAQWLINSEIPDSGVSTGPQLVLHLFEKYLNNATIVKQASGTIAALTLRQPEIAQEMVVNGAPNLLAKALELYRSNASVMRAVCMAIRNCVSRSPELCSAFYDSDDSLGIERLLNSLLSNAECNDQAKAALRDLGCQVELKELWKGSMNISL